MYLYVLICFELRCSLAKCPKDSYHSSKHITRMWKISSGRLCSWLLQTIHFRCIYVVDIISIRTNDARRLGFPVLSACFSNFSCINNSTFRSEFCPLEGALKQGIICCSICSHIAPIHTLEMYRDSITPIPSSFSLEDGCILYWYLTVDRSHSVLITFLAHLSPYWAARIPNPKLYEKNVIYVSALITTGWLLSSPQIDTSGIR